MNRRPHGGEFPARAGRIETHCRVTGTSGLKNLALKLGKINYNGGEGTQCR
jgi:hypothetical protein